ncbi:hypothetical protein BDC45DRAFT_505896 [Circinella umbellata]|nr:hypothetical protein BDC45DRAFT_505896 [Circinella umbellata]
MTSPGCESMQQQPAHVPFAVLKVQLKRLVSQHDSKGVIFTRDLLTLINEYEQEQDVMLLSLDQKTAIQPYTMANPDLEMSADDILNLLKLVFPTPSMTTVVRPRTSPPLSTGSNSHRRPSHLSITSGSSGSNEDISNEEQENITTEPIEATSKLEETVGTLTIDDDVGIPRNTRSNSSTSLTNKPKILSDEPEEDDDEVSSPNVAQYYRRSIQLTRRLKLSERSLASMTRDNEDRIIQLQNRVEDMNQEVVKQKREIFEYKSKEKNSLDQIGALESHIAQIERSETDQKQVYLSIKRLFDEKCHETQDLQEMLRHKELELQKTEALLSSIHHEFQQLNEERNKLKAMQNNLEHELATSHYTHMQLAEQRSENERLKEIIDGLKFDLEAKSEEAIISSLSNDNIMTTHDTINDNSNRNENNTNSTEAYTLINTLRAELESHDDFREDIQIDNATEERLKSVENEKDYYKSQADAAMQDLDRVKQEFKYALDQEKELLVNQLANMGMKVPDRRDDIDNLRIANGGDMDVTNTVEPFAIQVASKQSFTDNTTIDMNTTTDIWDQSRIRQRKLDKARRRGTVQDLNESTAFAVNAAIAANNSTLFASDNNNNNSSHSRSLIRPTNDRAVTNTATFAIYTLLVYIFGIVTSTFLLDGQPGSWEQALVAAATQQGGSRSKILEILIYWIEKLLFEGDGVPLS